MSRSHKFLFVGDAVLNTKPKFSTELQRLFEDANIRCCNFEAPLRGYGKAVSKTGPLVDQDPESIHTLQELGFNLFSLANNHICDYGDEGLLETLKRCPQDRVLGVGKEEEAYDLRVITIDQIKYGFVSYGENGYGALNGDRDIGYAWVNHERVDRDIAAFKDLVDVLIVQVHAGVEMLDVPIPEWKKRYYELIDHGADVLIVHHPHILQGIEVYKDKLISYSLGNFYFDYPSNHPQWNIGGVLEIEFHEGKRNQYHLHVVEKKEQLMTLWDEKSAYELLRALNGKLVGADYERYVDQEVLALWLQHHTRYYGKAVNGLVDYSLVGVLKHIKRILFHRGVDYNMMWHNLFIESNIWLAKRAVRQLK